MSARWPSVAAQRGGHDAGLPAVIPVTDDEALGVVSARSERLLRTSAEQATDVITCRGPDGTFTYVSPSVEAVLGWRPDEVIGSGAELLWHPEDLERGRRLLATMVVGAIGRMEWRARRRDGSYVWCESTVRLHVDPETGQAEVWAALRDISERRRAEDRYRLLAELCPVPVLVHDAGTVVYANRALASLAGAKSPQELVGRSIETLVTVDARPGVVERARSVIEDGAMIRGASTVGVRLDGSTVEVEVSSAPFPLAERIGSLVVIHDVSAARRAVALLEASEARYRELIAHLRGSAVFIYDRDLRVVMAAGPALAEVGLDAKELVGRRAGEVLDPADYELLLPRFSAGLAGEASTVAYESARSRRHYVVDVIPLPIGVAGTQTIQVVARDVTELRTSERTALAASARYSAAIGAAPIGVAAVGLDGRYQFVNETLCAMLGYTAVELLATTAIAVAHPDDRRRAEAALTSIRSGAIREYRTDERYLDAGGRTVWADVSAIVVADAEGQAEHLLVFIVDISDRVRQEELLKQSEERFGLLAEAATEGVCITEEGRIVSANPALAAMYGYEPHEVVGLTVEAFAAPESRNDVLRQLAEASDVSAEFVGLRKDGTRFPLLATGRSVSYRGRRARVSAVTDLTAHKRNAALEERRRIARDLHDGLAHELAFVSTKAKSLRRQAETGEAIDALVTAADRALDEARRAISVLSSAQRERLGVALAMTAEDLTARHGMTLLLRVDPSLDAVPQVAENLLRIVREAITNAARHGKAKSVVVRGWRDTALHVTVRDDGHGFDPTAARGGFGLVSMRERAQAVGATLELSSTPEAGTVIEVVVP